MTYRHMATLMSTATMATAIAAPAHAVQTVPEQQAAQAANEANPTTDSASSASGQEVVVTAQKRAQALIDVPQSVSVVSGATLEQQQATTFSDYLKFVPGLQLNQSTQGAGRLIVRGVNTGGVASTVGVYVDESPFGSSSGLVNAATLAADFDTFDLDRIEVLRGPQGTFYGASSLSGVLKFITKLPSTTKTTVRGRVGTEFTDGGDMGYFGNAVVNVPLGDTLAVRASGTYRKFGGFIDSIGTNGSDREKNINDAKSFGGRASLLYRPADSITLRLTAHAQNIETDAPSVIEADPTSLRRLYGGLTQSQFVPQFTDIRYRLYNGTGTFDLGFADLTSSTSYSTQKQQARIDFTNSLAPFIQAALGVPNEFIQAQRTNSKKFTQELRLSGAVPLLDWLTGVYYTREKGLIVQDLTALTPGTLTPITGLPLLAHVDLPSKYRELAGFANVTLHLGEQFDLDLGGRYSRNKQSAQQISNGLLAGGANTFPVARSSEKVFTYSVAPKYKLSKDASLYARVAKGFRPGGPNVLPPGAPADTPGSYRSDSVISYEVGFKGQTSDQRFSIDAAAFHVDWKDIQLLTVVNGFGLNANGGKARSDGVEVTGTARLLTGLDLSANAAYTHARLTQDAPALVGGFRGQDLPFSPRFVVGLNGDYRWSLAANTEAHVGASLRHLSRQSGDFDADFQAANDRQRRIRSYNTVDLTAGVDFGRISVDAYARNIGNSRGITSTSGTTVFGAFPVYPGGAIGTGIIRPRTIGISLTAGY